MLEIPRRLVEDRKRENPSRLDSDPRGLAFGLKIDTHVHQTFNTSARLRCQRVSGRIFGLQIPEPRRGVPASSDNPAVIQAESYCIDVPIVATQNHGVSGLIFYPQIPEPRRFVLAAGDNPVVIRACTKVASEPI